MCEFKTNKGLIEKVCNEANRRLRDENMSLDDTIQFVKEELGLEGSNWFTKPWVKEGDEDIRLDFDYDSLSKEGDQYIYLDFDANICEKEKCDRKPLKVHYVSYDGAALTGDPPEHATWGLFIAKNGAMEVARYKYDILDHFYPSQAMIQIDDVIAWIDLDDIRTLVSGIEKDD